MAYVSARNIRDTKTRPNTLAMFQLAESGSVSYLKALSDRAAQEGDTWLSEKLARHASDEERHGQIFAHSLKQINKQVIDFKNLPKTTQEDEKKERRRSPFFEAFYEGFSQEDLKPQNIDWLVFLGSTYILELDASKDFQRMANVLPEDELISRNLKKSIESVARDEVGHAAYLREAMERRLSADAVEQLIDQWRTRKVNALLATVTNLVQKGGKSPTLVQDGAPTELSNDAPQDTASEPVAA